MTVSVDFLPDQQFRGKENRLIVEVGLVRQVGTMPGGTNPIYQSRTVEIEISNSSEIADLEFIAESLYPEWRYQCVFLDELRYYC